MVLSDTRTATFRGLWPLLLAVLACQNLIKSCSANNDVVDALEGDLCANLTKDGKCESEPELMAKYCAKTYYEWVSAERKLELQRQKRDIKVIKDESLSFYDLSATSNEGKPIAFDTFEGYVTLVAVVPKACDEGAAAEKSLQILRDVLSKWPLVVEVVVFPFTHPDSHYYATEDECSVDHYQMAIEKGNSRNMKSMKEIGIHNNRDGSVTMSPVYKYFKDVFGFNTISATSPTVFLVSPDGDVVEAFYDGSIDNVENSIREHIKQEL